MKTKLFILITVLITTLAFTMTVGAGQRGKGKKGKRDQGYQQDQGRDRGYQQDRNRGRYHKPPKWGKRRNHRRHIPNYYRHPNWKRWNDWDRHYRKHPRRYPSGKYHYDRQGNLMFSYCDSDTGNCFSFGFYF